MYRLLKTTDGINNILEVLEVREKKKKRKQNKMIYYTYCSLRILSLIFNASRGIPPRRMKSLVQARGLELRETLRWVRSSLEIIFDSRRLM